MNPDTLTERHLSSATNIESLTLFDWIKSIYQKKVTYILGTSKISFNDAPPVPWFQTAIKKLYDLENLEYNWDSEGAPPINIDCIFTAMRLLEQITQDNTPEPYIFPTLQGGVQFEWHTKKVDLEIEIIDPSTALVLFDDEEEKEHDWEQGLTPNDLPKLIDCIIQLV